MKLTQREFSLNGKAFLRACDIYGHIENCPKKDVLNLNKERLDYIISNKIQNVIFVCRWQNKVWGLKAELTNRKNPKWPMVVDSKAKELNHEESFYSFSRQYEKTI